MTKRRFPPAFSAVLMMGGQSRRMGRDKAMLPWPERPLWERQLAVLQALQPGEILISARPDHVLPPGDFRRVHDQRLDAGPLGGFSAAMDAARGEWLVVLAVDLPAITADFLANLLAQSAVTQRGVIPQIGGRFEPLAAIFPRACAPLVRELLAGADHSLQHFARAAIARHLADAAPVAVDDQPLFHNLNSPADLQQMPRPPAW